jgi:hypothetical protein
MFLNTGGPEAAPGPVVPPAGTPDAPPVSVPTPSSAIIPPPGQDTVMPPVGTATQLPSQIDTPPVVPNPTASTDLIPPVPTSILAPAVTTSRRQPGWKPKGTGRPGGNNLIATSASGQKAAQSGTGLATETANPSYQCPRKRRANARRRAARSKL